MCFRQKMPPPQPMPLPPPVQPNVANTAALQQGKLPDSREAINPEDIEPVEYGTTLKQGASGKKTGTSSLKIDVNLGGDNPATGGGINV